jgi:hypothetical protein
MAIYNEILAGRYNRFAQKLFNMKGRPPAPQLSGDVQLSQQLFSGSENRFLENWNLWGAAAVIPANAGQVADFQIRGGAGVLTVVEKVLMWTTGAAEEVDLGSTTATTDLATIPAPSGREMRLTQASGSASVVSSTNAGGIGPGTVFGRFFLPANDQRDCILYEEQQLVLVAGFAYRWQATVANQNLGYSIWWRERPIEDSEVKG